MKSKLILFTENWDDVCDEICRSNIIQRDNQKFARKLNKDLVKLAKERSELVSKIIDNILRYKFLILFRLEMSVDGQSELAEK